jgi:hypothetical protein
VGYPSGIQTFTTKSAGQTIQPADINSPQTEITAIETGLLSGFQHGITVAVAGITQSASTGVNSLAGTLQVTGGSTFSSNVNIVGTLLANGSSGSTSQFLRGDMTWADPQAVVVAAGLTGSTTQIANGSTAAVTWPTQVFATNSSIHSTATNPERLTPQSTGVYALDATLRLATTLNVSTGSFQARVEDSSGGVLDFQIVGQVVGHAPTVHVHATKLFDVVGSTQWLRVVASQASGSTHSLNGSENFLRFYKL